MTRSIAFTVAVAVLTCGSALTQAVDIGTEIDLAALSQPADQPSSSDDLPLQEVARHLGTAPRRVYLSGMIGPSFANVTSPASSALASSDTLFNAGAAIGVAFERHNGRLRLETEGMGRSTYDAPFTVAPTPGESTILTNNWSVMENVWRDIMVSDRFGIYGGGGLGAGGYILGEQVGGAVDYASPAANFAWQFGGGLIWEITERLTFDVGYRYFHIDSIQQVNTRSNVFDASELMFTLRLYEPFRSWR